MGYKTENKLIIQMKTHRHIQQYSGHQRDRDKGERLLLTPTSCSCAPALPVDWKLPGRAVPALPAPNPRASTRLLNERATRDRKGFGASQGRLLATSRRRRGEGRCRPECRRRPAPPDTLNLAPFPSWPGALPRAPGTRGVCDRPLNG